MNDTQRRIETAQRLAVRQRNYRRVRDRALARLARAHQEEYKELLEQERLRDEAEGKTWRDISGRTSDSVAGNQL